MSKQRRQTTIRRSWGTSVFGRQTTQAVLLTVLMLVGTVGPAAAGIGTATAVDRDGASSVGGGGAGIPSQGTATADGGPGDVASAAGTTSTAARVTVDGTIRGPGGSPLAGTSIELYASSIDDFLFNQTDSNGRYAVAPVANTDYEVAFEQRNSSVAYPDDGVADVYAFGTESYAANRTINRTVPAGHRLNVTVVDESGNPINDSRVFVVHYQNNASASAGGNTTGNGVWVPRDANQPGLEVNGTVDIVAEGPDGSLYLQNVTTVNVSSARNVTLTLDEGVRVSGQITYPDGTGAANTTIAYRPENRSGEYARNVTDSSGRFSVLVSKNESYQVGFWQAAVDFDSSTSFPRDGIADYHLFGTAYFDSNTTVNYDVPVGHVLNVTVQNASGSPIENASVGLFSTNGDAFHGFYDYRRAIGPPTDAQGVMVHPPNGQPGVEVNGTTNVFVEPPSDRYGRNGTEINVSSDRDITLTLNERVTVNGTVYYPNGTAASNVTLRWHNDSDFVSVTTDTDGQFSARLQSDLNYTVDYWQGPIDEQDNVAFPKDGVADFATLGSFSASSDTTVQFEVPVGHTLNVTVQNRSGTPIENASVGLRHASGGTDAYIYSYLDRNGVPTDSQGRMVHPPNREPGIEVNGSVDVRVSPPPNSGYDRNFTSVTVDRDRDVTLTLERRATLNGTIRYPNGSVAPDVTVRLFNRSQRDFHSVTTDANGEFSVALLPDTSYQTAYWQGPIDQQANVSFPKDGVADFATLGRLSISQDATREAQVPVGHTLNVTVRNETGEPLANASVYLRDGGDDGVGFYSYRQGGVPTDPQGRMVHPPNGDPGIEVNGSLDVYVQPPPNTDYGGNVTQVNVTGDRDVEVVLSRPINITGRILDGSINATPVANASVVGFGPETRLNETNRDGLFVLRNVAANSTYEVGMGQLDRLGSHDGVPDIYSLGEVQVGGDDVDLGNRSLPRPVVVNVTVVDGTAAGVPNATINVSHTASDGSDLGLTLMATRDGVLKEGPDAGIELYGNVTIEVTGPYNSTAYAPERKRVNEFVGVSYFATRSYTFTVNRTQVDPRSVQFPDTTEGQTTTETVTVTNNGDERLAVNDTVTNGSAFTVVSGGGSFTLAPGESRDVTVEFAPSASGTFEGELVFTNYEPSFGPELTVPLAGNGTASTGGGGSATPSLSVSPGSVEFDETRIGDTVTATVTIANTGDAAANVSSLAIRGDAAFEVTDRSFTLSPGERRDVTVRFAPEDPGSFEGSLVVRSDAPGSPHETTLTGSAVGIPAVSVEPDGFEFGNVRTGSAVQTSVVVTNVGSGTLTLSNLDVGGDRFSLVGNVPTALEPGESARITVEFAADQPGTYEDAVQFSTNDANRSTVRLPLTATAVESDLGIEPSTLDFENVTVQRTSTRTVTLTNDGNAPVNISAVEIVGPDGTAFDVSEAIEGETIAGGERVELTVEFRPRTAGPKTARLEVTPAGGEPLSVPLTGTGSRPKLGVSRTTLDFGNVTVDERVTATLTLSNTGSEPLRVSAATIVGANPGAFELVDVETPLTLAPGESRTVTVAFQPTAPGAKSAILRFRTNDPRKPVVNVWLSNTRTRVEIDVEGDQDNKSEVNVNVTNAKDNSTLSLNVSTPETENATSSVDEVNLTVEEGGNFSLNVTNSEERLNTTGEFTPNETNNTAPVGYLNVSHTVDDRNISEVEFTFRVRKSALRKRNASVEDVVLYRKVDGEWQELETEIVRETDDAWVLRAVSPGLSDFVTGIKQPNFEVVDAAVSVAQVQVGEEAGVEVTIDNTGGADGTFTAKLLLNGEVVDRKTVTVVAGSRRVLVFEQQIDEAGTYTVKVNNVTAGQVEVSGAEAGGSVTPTAGGGGGDGSGDSPLPVPGFGLLPALLALAALALLARRRR